jgi:hypothetical protein
MNKQTFNYKSGGSASVFKTRKRSKQNIGARVDVHNYKFQSVKERCKIILTRQQRHELEQGFKLVAKSNTPAFSSCIICVDADAFYAQVLLLQKENKQYKTVPFAVTQKHIVVTCK